MEKYRCPVAVKNKQAHAKFIELFTTMRERYEKEGASAALAIQMQRVLLDWLVGHIKGTDTQLHPCVKKRGDLQQISTSV